MAVTEGEQAIIDELRKIRRVLKGMYGDPQQAEQAETKP